MNILKNEKVLFVLDILINLLFIVVLAYLIRNFIVSPFHVYGPSMCSTVNDRNGQCLDTYGDYIIVNEFTYQKVFGKSLTKPAAGDVIVFKPPLKMEKDQYYVKRIIGEPGETIRIVDGFVYKKVDDGFFLLDESEYLNEDNYGRTYTEFGSKPIEFAVPDNNYFVMGDNRNRSTDSRHCFAGGSADKCDSDNEMAFVPFKNIRGKAWFVFYPFSSIKMLKSADYNIEIN